MRKWKPFIRTKIERHSDGSLWIADGAVPFPLHGYNFARIRKAWLGWWVYPLDRWVHDDPKTFSIRQH